MGGAYWIIEYLKVLFAYGFVLYVWPSVVFRKYLRDRTRSFRFCFNVCMTMIIINTVVLCLGLVHLLKIQLVAALFFGTFIVQLYRNYHLSFKWLKDIKSLMLGTLTFRNMIRKWVKTLWKKVSLPMRRWWESTRGHRVEYAALIAILIFGTMYFSINVLEVHSYGFGDSYVHHQWVYGLIEGKPFAYGIYPECMHCVVYLVAGAFGINTYSTMLFFAGVHIHVYLISAYLLMRRLFKWRMTPHLALMGFLTVDQLAINTVFGMSRLAWTVPQEYGMFTVYMIPFTLICFLRQRPDAEKLKFRPFKLSYWKEIFNDKYLLLFMLSVAVSIAIHFYAAIIAAFICMVVVAVNAFRVFERNKFFKLAIAAMLALFIAVVPMAGALATGHKLQGSLYWAIAVTRGGEKAWASGDYDASKDYIPKDDEDAKLPLGDRVVKHVKQFINESFIETLQHKRGTALLVLDLGMGALSAAVLGVLIVIRFIQKLRGVEKDKRTRGEMFNSYLIIAIAVMTLMVAYNPFALNLPPIVAGSRVCSTLHMFSNMLYMTMLDIFLVLLGYVAKPWVTKSVSVLAIVGVYITVRMLGMFHGYLYYELTRYPAAVELTKEITQNIPEDKFTIISTTDELYQVIESGYHVEWIDMLENSGKKTYTIPTDYLFFYIEKKPIQYAQSSFASGPSWLAEEEKYVHLWADSGSQYPYINHGRISDFLADQPIAYGRKKASTANNLGNRQILESRAYRWYKLFSEMHPNAGEVIYEDDDILCFCVHQNPYSLYSLGIMPSSNRSPKGE